MVERKAAFTMHLYNAAITPEGERGFLVTFAKMTQLDVCPRGRMSVNLVYIKDFEEGLMQVL